jgi:hypothetical protein
MSAPHYEEVARHCNWCDEAKEKEAMEVRNIEGEANEWS